MARLRYAEREQRVAVITFQDQQMWPGPPFPTAPKAQVGWCRSPHHLRKSTDRLESALWGAQMAMNALVRAVPVFATPQSPSTATSCLSRPGPTAGPTAVSGSCGIRR